MELRKLLLDIDLAKLAAYIKKVRKKNIATLKSYIKVVKNA